MNFGPLEFAAYLRNGRQRRRESAAVRAARAAAAVPPPERNRLTVISGPREMRRVDHSAELDSVAVFEAIAGSTLGTAGEPLRVRVKSAAGRLVLVLSAHQTTRWQVEIAPRARLVAVLLAGRGDSRVIGAGQVPVASMGGFYAFRPGTQEFRHLENEVLRATGCTVRIFHRGRAHDGLIELGD